MPAAIGSSANAPPHVQKQAVMRLAERLHTDIAVFGPKREPGGFEMAIVRRGDADDIDSNGDEPWRGVGAGVALERSDAVAGFLLQPGDVVQVGSLLPPAPPREPRLQPPQARSSPGRCSALPQPSLQEKPAEPCAISLHP